MKLVITLIMLMGFSIANAETSTVVNITIPAGATWGGTPDGTSVDVFGPEKILLTLTCVGSKNQMFVEQFDPYSNMEVRGVSGAECSKLGLQLFNAAKHSPSKLQLSISSDSSGQAKLGFISQ